MRYRMRRVKSAARGRLRRKDRKRLASGAILAILIVVILLISFLIPGKAQAKISLEDFRAFRIPYQAATGIYTLAEKYSVSFPKLLTVYSLDHSFFPKGTKTTVQMLEIETGYMLNFDRIDERYPQDKYGEYFAVVSALFSEVKAFPAAPGTSSEDYMYGDGYGTKKGYDGNGINYGTDIFDRENTRGRIAIVSMTDGTIGDIGWSTDEGFFVSVTSNNGTVYRYSRFDSYTSGLRKGDAVSAGQQLGKMGDTGNSLSKGNSTNSPVHTHITIAPATSLGKKPFYINPYVILRYAEWRFMG